MPLKVLIADDSATNRLLLSMTMTRAGIATDIAANGREAVDLFTHNSYDVVFLDLEMPVMSGIEAARTIKKQNPKNIPVYAISGFPSAEAESFFDEADIRGCLIKPLDHHKIIAVSIDCGLIPTLEKKAEKDKGHIPALLIRTYAHELRARGKACIRHIREKDYPGIRREAHTIAALGQMLETPEIESACRALEQSCNAHDQEKLAILGEELCDRCHETAYRIETASG